MSVTINPPAGRNETFAVDLLEHPGYLELLRDIESEAMAARRVVFRGKGDTAEAQGLAAATARGSLAALYRIVNSLHQRANVPIPERLQSLFQ